MTITTLPAFSGCTDNAPASPSYFNSKFSQVVSMITTLNAAANSSASSMGIANVMDYGAVGDGSTDDAAAIRAAIAAAPVVYFPDPSPSYLVGSVIEIAKPVALIGQNVSATVIERGFSGSKDTDGIFHYTDGSSWGLVDNLTLRSKTGQTGGCLLSIVNTNADAVGGYRFTGVDFTTTGTSTHSHTVWMNGTARTSAPIGLRGVDFVGCNVFGGAVATLVAKGVLKLGINGGGVYNAGGVATSEVSLDGTAGVPTSSFAYLPADSSCDINMDNATMGFIACGQLAKIRNTTNTTFIYGHGNASSVSTQWSFSNFYNTGDRTWHGTSNYSETVNFKGPVSVANATMTFSTATLNLGQSRLVSVRTAASLDSTTLRTDEVAFTIAGASGASLAIRSGGTIWYFSSSASTKG